MTLTLRMRKAEISRTHDQESELEESDTHRNIKFKAGREKQEVTYLRSLCKSVGVAKSESYSKKTNVTKSCKEQEVEESHYHPRHKRYKKRSFKADDYFISYVQYCMGRPSFIPYMLDQANEQLCEGSLLLQTSTESQGHPGGSGTQIYNPSPELLERWSVLCIVP